MWWIGTKAVIDAANVAATAALPDDRNAATGQVVPDVTMRWDDPVETTVPGVWAIREPPGTALPAGVTAQAEAPALKVQAQA